MRERGYSPHMAQNRSENKSTKTKKDSSTLIRVYDYAHNKINEFIGTFKNLYVKDPDAVEKALNGRFSKVNISSEGITEGLKILEHKISARDHYTEDIPIHILNELMIRCISKRQTQMDRFSEFIVVVITNKHLNFTYVIEYVFEEYSKKWIPGVSKIYEGIHSNIPPEEKLITEPQKDDYISVDSYNKALKIIMEKEILADLDTFIRMYKRCKKWEE